MELHEAIQHHQALVALLKRHKVKNQGDHSPIIAQEQHAMTCVIGRYAQAYNPKIAAKALAFIKGN